jgi:hypothetical protein
VTGRPHGRWGRPGRTFAASPAANPSRRQPPAPRCGPSAHVRRRKCLASHGADGFLLAAMLAPGRPALSPGDCPRPHAATPPGAVRETRADSPGRRHRSSRQTRRRFGRERLLSAITTLPYVTRQVHHARRQNLAAVSGSPCSRRCRPGTPPRGAAAGPRRAGWRRPRSARSAPGRPGRAPPSPRAGGFPTPEAGR